MNAPAILIKPSTVRLERLLPGPLERVWAYIVESEKRARWLAGGEFELRVGGAIELVFENDKLSDESRDFGTKKFAGRITKLEPMRLLAHSWDWDGKDSEVVYTLEPRGKDVLLTVVHRLPEGSPALKGVGGGWATHVGILEDLLKGAKPRGFWSTHDREMKAFESALQGS